MVDLPLAPVRRLIKRAGAERVSDDAVDLLQSHISAQGDIVSETAVNFAKHAGRKTVTGADIELAIKTLYD